MMSITDADRTLAAELGLYLVQLPETSEDRRLAADPRALRAPQNWAVKSALDHKLVGRLNFTPVDCLYATKYAAGISGIEETVADALRWMTRLRHVRTGTYDETIVGPKFERACAITECGAMATSADYNKIAAKSTLINGQAHEMCPACLAKLEARGIRDLSNLSERAGSSTAKQRGFIRRLLDESARSGRPHLMAAWDIDGMSSRAASATIDALMSLKARDWKGEL